jgi:hypothetical protein
MVRSQKLQSGLDSVFCAPTAEKRSAGCERRSAAQLVVPSARQLDSPCSVCLELSDIREKSQETGFFYCPRKLPLVLGAGAACPARDNLGPLGQKARKQPVFLVVDILDVVLAKIADFSASFTAKRSYSHELIAPDLKDMS